MNKTFFQRFKSSLKNFFESLTDGADGSIWDYTKRLWAWILLMVEAMNEQLRNSAFNKQDKGDDVEDE